MLDDNTAATRVAREIRKEVEPLPAGARIASQRLLVKRYGVSASTVARAIALLSQQGLVESRPGAGCFRARAVRRTEHVDLGWQQGVLDRQGEHSQGRRALGVRGIQDTLSQFPPDVVDLNGGYLHPDLRPAGSLSSALARVSKRGDAWNRPGAGGVPEMRDWFAQEISPSLGRSDILIAPGGQAALATTLRALAQPGDRVVVESPTYPGTLAAIASAGVRAVPLSVDGEGIRPEDLEAALHHSRVSAMVLQPLYQNPVGATMSPARRAAVLRLAYAHGVFIVEDDFARYLSHMDAKAVPPPLLEEDERGCVVHIRSLTKPTSPNLRIAAVASRGAVTARIRDALTTDSLLVPAVLQHTALEVVTSSAWCRARKSLSLELQRRRSAAVDELTRQFGEGVVYGNPSGGYHLWVHILENQSAEQFSRGALARGVAVTPGGNYYLDGHPDPSFFRLSYVTVATETELREGIRRLRS